MTAEEEKVVAEWRAAMEGVPGGPWIDGLMGESQSDGEVYYVRSSACSPLEIMTEGPDIGIACDKAVAAYIRRCSPSGISALLALIESQRATIERVERERDEARASISEHIDLGRKVAASLQGQLTAESERAGRWEASALAAEARVTDLKAALETISCHYDNQDLSHLDFRVKAAECARQALSRSSTEVKNDDL